MFTVEAIDAGHGDCFLIRFIGNGGANRTILIDGGPDKAEAREGNHMPYRDRLLPRLMQLRAASSAPKLKLDLVVCTHIDADHIDGIRLLYQCLSGNDCISADGASIEAPRLWFNSFARIMDGVDIAAAVRDAKAASVADGENLTTFALQAGASINDFAEGSLVAQGHKDTLRLKPATIRVLSPGVKQLTRLKEHWVDTMRDEPQADTSAVSRRWAAADNSVANLSSIAMLIEGGGRKLLMCGDQRGDFILEGLRDLALSKDKEIFHVDLMTVPHHGSDANNLPKFHQAVTADTYIFSANGKHQNPDIATLQLIASQAATGRKFTMAFTQPDFDYTKSNKGDLPKFAGTDIRTLQEAIVALKTLPGVADNVTFRFRDEGANAIEFAFAPNS